MFYNNLPCRRSSPVSNCPKSNSIKLGAVNCSITYLTAVCMKSFIIGNFIFENKSNKNENFFLP